MPLNRGNKRGRSKGAEHVYPPAAPASCESMKLASGGEALHCEGAGSYGGFAVVFFWLRSWCHLSGYSRGEVHICLEGRACITAAMIDIFLLLPAIFEAKSQNAVRLDHSRIDLKSSITGAWTVALLRSSRGNQLILYSNLSN